jgi:hypothetical protein
MIRITLEITASGDLAQRKLILDAKQQEFAPLEAEIAFASFLRDRVIRYSEIIKEDGK